MHFTFSSDKQSRRGLLRWLQWMAGGLLGCSFWTSGAFLPKFKLWIELGIEQGSRSTCGCNAMAGWRMTLIWQRFEETFENAQWRKVKHRWESVAMNGYFCRNSNIELKQGSRSTGGCNEWLEVDSYTTAAVLSSQILLLLLIMIIILMVNHHWWWWCRGDRDDPNPEDDDVDDGQEALLNPFDQVIFIVHDM